MAKISKSEVYDINTGLTAVCFQINTLNKHIISTKKHH